jgi:tetratricopeptide (TPR) repeat protein
MEKTMRLKFFFISFILISSCAYLNAGSYLEDAEKLYLDKNVKDAIPLFEKALLDEPRNEQIYLFLSNSYEILNEPQKSIDTLEKGLRVARDSKYKMYFNMGNNYYTMGKYKLSAEMLSLAITYKSDFDPAFINRAQSYIQLVDYKSALSDYKHYLELAPQSPQRKEVEEIIRLLSETLSDEEKAQLDKEAREKQLKDLIKSLEDAKDNSKDLSAGTEKLKEDYTEGELMN